MIEQEDQHLYCKQCSSPEAFANELLIYRMQLPFVPKLLAVEEPYTLVLERVDATTYLDYGDTWNVELMAQTIADFHLHNLQDGITICHHDNQPQNILYDGIKYYLIDFSDICLNVPEHDITHLMLFWAEEYPTDVLPRLCNRFISSYQEHHILHADMWHQHLELNTLRFDARRKEFNKLPAKDPLQSAANRQYLKQLL